MPQTAAPEIQSSEDSSPSMRRSDADLARDALSTGTQLGGYQIIDVIGRGGFGIVYLALDTSLQREVAIKEYLPADVAMRCEDNQVWLRPGADAHAYAAGLNAFIDEAKLLARFDHPSLARVHAFWEENRTAYMVMPFYAGLTLSATLEGMKSPPEEAWLRALSMPLLGALDLLHASQCLHLDISPDNILVQPDGRPVLLDFGVAHRAASDKTLPLTALLNPLYAPIEQYSESATLPQGPWTDLYALAGVLHFAIVGQPPARATVRAIEDTQRPLADTVRARPGLRYSDEFLGAIDKALAVKPRDRPRNAADFQLLLNKRSGSVPPAPPRQPPAAAPAPFATSGRGGTPAPEDLQPTLNGKRTEPQFMPTQAPPEWIAADPVMRVHSPRKRRAGPLLLSSLCVAVAAGLAVWWWWPYLTPPHVRAALAYQFLGSTLPAPASVPKPERAFPVDPPLAANSGTAPNRPAWATNPDAAPSTSPAMPSATPPSGLNTPVPNTTSPQSGVTADTPAPEATRPAITPPVTSPATTPAQSVSPPATATAPARPTAPPPPAPPTAKASPPATAAPAAPVIAAVKPAAKPVPEPASTSVKTVRAGQAGSPRANCGSRTNFSLLYCMETECRNPGFARHPQCVALKATGEVN